MYTAVKTPAEIKAMRESGRMLAAVLKVLTDAVKPDMTTKDLAELAAKEVRALGGKPTFLGQYGFPDVICISVNQAVVHGIPSNRIVLENGDVLSLDFGVTYDGMITDGATTIIVGDTTKAPKRVQELVRATNESLEAAIFSVKNGVRVGDISAAVQTVLERHQLGIVRDLVGHGVGHELHEDPNIPNYGKKGTGPVLKTGMTIAIEPMATLGTHKVAVMPDKWTIVTQDGSLAAHFEKTILITDDGAEVLTPIE